MGEGLIDRAILGVGVSAGAGSSICATVDCVLGTSSSFEVGPSSGSVDVKVFVRYKAVCSATIAATHSFEVLQPQTPKLGKKFLTKLLSPQSSVSAMKVQPLGSSIMSTPLVCTASGRSG